MEMATWLHNGVEAPWLRMAPRSAEVLVIAGRYPRRDWGSAKKGRIVVGWARPDSNRRSSLCESDVLTAGLRAHRAGHGPSVV